MSDKLIFGTVLALAFVLWGWRILEAIFTGKNTVSEFFKDLRCALFHDEHRAFCKSLGTHLCMICDAESIEVIAKAAPELLEGK